MNIIFAINQHYPYGMAATLRIKLFTEFLVRKGANVNVLISNQDNALNSQSGSHNGVGYSTIIDKKIPKIIFYLLYPLAVTLEILKNKKKKSKNYILIYGDIDMYTLPFVIIAKISGYKIIQDIVEDSGLTDESSSWKGKVNSWFRELIMPYGMKFIDGIVVISMYLDNKYKVMFPHMPLVKIPVSAANLSYGPLIQKPSSEDLCFVYCGSFGIKDGLDYLIEAFDNVSKNHPNISLTLLGQAGNEIMDKVNSLENHNISFTGYLPDKDYWKALHSADILCMTRVDSPFAHAGFPFKLGEYLATARPVIATDVSDVRYYLEDKIDIVMAKPSDTPSLINAIEYLINNPDKRDLIGRNGYEKCTKYFNPEVNSQILLDFINEI
jgi:glycosyltransferase involved in cell wall biosynthesis